VFKFRGFWGSDPMKIQAAALVLLALGLGPVQAATAPTLSNWSVTKNYQPDGSLTCVLRFPNAKGAPILTVDEREKGGATFTLSGLPPLLAGNKGVIRGIWITIGKWAGHDLKGAWLHGSDGNGSRITFPANVPITALTRHISRGEQLKIWFDLANGRHGYTFTLAGGAAAAAENAAGI
jgi:hypothetical protein